MKESYIFALQMIILFGDEDRWRHHNIDHDLIQRARQASLDIAYVFRGNEGFGAHCVIHSTHSEAFAGNLPVGVVIIDTEENIRSFVPQVEELLIEGTISLVPCHLFRYRAP